MLFSCDIGEKKRLKIDVLKALFLTKQNKTKQQQQQKKKEKKSMSRKRKP